MDLALKGKTVIVTGSARGIGRAIVLGFAKEGANVAVVDIDEAKANEVAREAEGLGVKAIAVKTDVTNLDDARRMAKTVADKFGKIDVLVNNAATWIVNYFMDTKKEDWEKEIRVCFFGTVNCSRAVLEYMIPARSGAIVSIGSDAGRVGEPNQPVYSGAKAGVIAFTKAVAKDVARHKIRLNAVCPSMTRTDYVLVPQREAEAKGGEALEKFNQWMDKVVKLYPLRKIGEPEDVANMVVFLASDKCAGHVTGQTVSVNGGYAMV